MIYVSNFVSRLYLLYMYRSNINAWELYGSVPASFSEVDTSEDVSLPRTKKGVGPASMSLIPRQGG